MEKKSISVNEYERGFQHGYQKAVEDFLKGELRTSIVEDIEQIPLEALALSSRAKNCLHFAGCRSLGDLCRLSETQIATMRNLGVKTAAEVAEILAEHGLIHTNWTKYRIIKD